MVSTTSKSAGHAIQVFWLQPTRSLVFIQVQRFRQQRAKIAMHSQMKSRIIIFHRTEKLIHVNLRRQFLMDLSLQCLFWCFPNLHLSARELPPVFEITISTLCGEYQIVLANNRCNYFYLLHFFIIPFELTVANLAIVLNIN